MPDKKMVNLEVEKIIKGFMKKVYPEPNTGCWLWGGAMGSKQGHDHISAKRYLGFNYAHRFSFFIHNGDFDRRKLICHKCNIPWCVNPDHLYLGTYLDNFLDMVKSGNFTHKRAPGILSGKTKLCDNDIKKIRFDYKNGKSMSELSLKYLITTQSIWRIIKYKSWRHVE